MPNSSSPVKIHTIPQTPSTTSQVFTAGPSMSPHNFVRTKANHSASKAIQTIIFFYLDHSTLMLRFASLQDLLAAINRTKHGIAVASAHRKCPSDFAGQLAGCIVSSLSTNGL
ncbi:hypothetical protein P692DRAFT_20878483 [Suillus brevipes Sb2]|nr:hypothetical protein P692DRAFT_20878483 [Suillus brevipes Sb2]